jgi:hypothetical protein
MLPPSSTGTSRLLPSVGPGVLCLDVGGTTPLPALTSSPHLLLQRGKGEDERARPQMRAAQRFLDDAWRCAPPHASYDSPRQRPSSRPSSASRRLGLLDRRPSHMASPLAPFLVVPAHASATLECDARRRGSRGGRGSSRVCCGRTALSGLGVRASALFLPRWELLAARRRPPPRAAILPTAAGQGPSHHRWLLPPVAVEGEESRRET